MRVALVHDYLNEFGGAERVLLALSNMYPEAPIYTIYYKKDSSCGDHFKNKKIIQSWFSWLPYSHKLISPFRFLIPFIWASFDFSDYDLVITSASWAVTKGMKRGEKTKEICYLHTPPRYLWGYDTSRDWSKLWFAKAVEFYALIVNYFMRKYDFHQAQQVDLFVANSKNVGARIEKFYRIKKYEVVYPPVSSSHRENSLPRDFVARSSFSLDAPYYLTGGRMVRTKNFDLVIKACEMANVKLKIFGTGVEEESLKKLANDSVEFVGRVSDQELTNLYASAKAFIVAQKDEDFGMTPLEAASYGTPTIAYRAEGYLESVSEDKTGLFFDELNSESISKAIKKSGKIKWNKTAIKNHAKKFSREEFEKGIRQAVERVIN